MAREADADRAADVRSGMTANVTFDGTADAAADHAITLPATALFHRGETPAVWVVRKGTDTLELRPVSIGRYDERTVSITSAERRARRDARRPYGQRGERVRAVPPLHPEEFPSRTPRTSTSVGRPARSANRCRLGRRPSLQSVLVGAQASATGDFLIGLATIFGVIGYTRLAQSEDPPFTFRTMVIQTYWPAPRRAKCRNRSPTASAASSTAPYVDNIKSYSRPGESMIFFAMKDSAPVDQVPETWYQVRKKVGDIRATLPKGTVGPFFNDEFGDVYTNVYALEGDGYSPAQLHDYADRLRVLLRVPGVAKVDYFGDPAQHVFVEISNAQLTRLAITPQQLAQPSMHKTPSRRSAPSRPRTIAYS